MQTKLDTDKNGAKSRAYIPPKKHIHSTSDVDGVDTLLGYWGPFSYPMRERLNMAVRSFSQESGFACALDAGYGCGIMLPDLYHRLAPNGHLYGVDLHGEHDEVYTRLVTGEGMDRERVHLSQTSLECLPFEDGFFDLIVSMSVLEHIPPEKLLVCLSELRRVAQPKAEIVLGFPTDGLFIRGLSWVQRNDLKANHPSAHTDIFRAIHESGLRIVNKRSFPPLVKGPLVMHYNVNLIIV